MPTLLSVEVSPRQHLSTSRKLAEVFAQEWSAARADARIVHRDLAKTPPALVDMDWIGGAFAPADTHSAGAAAAIAESDALVAELQAADHLLIATPMFSFSVPAVLKAWIDQVVRRGVTVAEDNTGLLTGKRATVILATGGDFRPGSPVERFDHASGYLRQVLAWMGITEVEIVLADRARAGATGETAVEVFADEVRRSARAPQSDPVGA